MNSNIEKLDLHGVDYDDAKLLVENFLYINSLPTEIITGNSLKMQEIVIRISKSLGYECIFKNENNLGSLLIIKGIQNGCSF